MASVLSRRLGKRSLLGARVLGPPGAAPPSEPQAELLEGVAPQPFFTSKDTSCQEQPKEVLKAPSTSGLQQMAFQPGQKVGWCLSGQVPDLPRLVASRPVVPRVTGGNSLGIVFVCVWTLSLPPCGPVGSRLLERMSHQQRTQDCSLTGSAAWRKSWRDLTSDFLDLDLLKTSVSRMARAQFFLTCLSLQFNKTKGSISGL